MREFKVRIWDTYTKEFAESHTKYSDEVLLGTDGRVEIYACDEGGCHLSRVADDRYIISQYIGLKDKNGKEIYEGDRLVSCGIACVVVWESCGFVGRGYYDGEIYSLGGFDFEVKSNIYEQFELMGEK